jgi:stage III sporulation protein AG
LAKWLQWLEQRMGAGPGGEKRVKTLRILILIGCVGALIMILSSFLDVKEVDPPGDVPSGPDEQAFAGQSEPKSPFHEIEEEYERRIKETLEKIVGVGTVDVLVTIDSTEETIVQQNVKDSQQVTNEKDQNGAERRITSITRDGQVVLYESSGNQVPIVVKKIKPKIRGVLIVARGAENETVKSLIFDAVQKGLNVPAFRISIVPRKQ